jgi:hypothetical protein
MRVAPEKFPLVAVEFEYARVSGSNIPTFEDPTLAVIVRDGAKMMFPDGSRHAPPKKVWVWVVGEGTVMFDETEIEGLITIMFEFIGVPMMFPFGASVRPENPAVPTTRFEAARLTGLN